MNHSQNKAHMDCVQRKLPPSLVRGTTDELVSAHWSAQMKPLLLH
jgi:hypothetical protein